MNTPLAAAVRDYDAKLRTMYNAQEAWLVAKAAVIDTAIAAGITSRVVLVLGETAYYVDPPRPGNGEWSVTWGSRPEEIPVESETDTRMSLDERYCPRCSRFTEHDIYDAGHERDSSHNWKRCRVCEMKTYGL